MHWIRDISFEANTIRCSCDALVVADAALPIQGGLVWPLNDPDQPLINAWAAHRKAEGMALGQPSKPRRVRMVAA